MTDPLQKYGFQDKEGHPLENCVEYRQLIADAELGRLVRGMEGCDVYELCICPSGWYTDEDKNNYKTPEEALIRAGVQEAMKCFRCKRPIPEDFNFCDECIPYR